MILYMLKVWFISEIHVNSTVVGKYNKHKQDGGHLRFLIRTVLATVDQQVTSILPIYMAHTSTWGSNFDLEVKRSNVNIGPSY